VLFLAEFYLTGESALAAVVARARAGAARASALGPQVSFVQAIFVPGDETCFAVYCSLSAGQVRAAGSLAGLDFDRIEPALTAS
jgi:hypothetical protein